MSASEVDRLGRDLQAGTDEGNLLVRALAECESVAAAATVAQEHGYDVSEADLKAAGAAVAAESESGLAERESGIHTVVVVVGVVVVVAE